MKEGRRPMLNLKVMRIKCGMTQVELAKVVGISQNALSLYEIGERRPRRDILSRLAEALGCEVKDLL